MKKFPVSVVLTEKIFFPNQPSQYLHKEYRLKISVDFLTKEKNLSAPFSAIVDTGGPISVIPYHIWKNIYIEKYGEGVLKGIHQGKECQIPCLLGRVLMRILDPLQEKYFKLKPLAYLVPEEFSNKLPLVLGYDQCLEFFRLDANIPNKKAYLIHE